LVPSYSVPETVTDTFAGWLLSQGVGPATATAYAQDVAREGLTVTSAVSTHEDVAQKIVNSELAAPTRARRLASCARFFDYTHPDADTAKNPYRVVRRPRTGVTLPTVVTTPDQARSLIEEFLDAGAYVSAAAVALMAGAGLRVGEATSVTWGHLNLDAGRVRVTGKGDKTRDVPLGEFATTVLRRCYAVAAERADVQEGDRVVPVSPRTVQRALSSVSERVQVPGLHPHALRHGFATAVQEHSGDLRLTADLLGHASISTTVKYTHVADARRVEAVGAAL
jgi:integrase/recombinase XerC